MRLKDGRGRCFIASILLLIGYVLLWPPPAESVPPNGRAAILIGACVGKGGWTAANDMIGPLQTHRLFYTALPAKFEADKTPDNIVLIASYKTRNTNVVNYVNSVPDSRQVILIYHHEPEGDYVSGACSSARLSRNPT